MIMKNKKAYAIMRDKVSLALSRMTATILGGNPQEHYYPSDSLYDWGYHYIDANGERIARPLDKGDVSGVKGIRCWGRHHENTPRMEFAYMFDEIPETGLGHILEFVDYEPGWLTYLADGVQVDITGEFYRDSKGAYHYTHIFGDGVEMELVW